MDVLVLIYDTQRNCPTKIRWSAGILPAMSAKREKVPFLQFNLNKINVCSHLLRPCGQDARAPAKSCKFFSALVRQLLPMPLHKKGRGLYHQRLRWYGTLVTITPSLKRSAPLSISEL